jgi:hypothetical protein
MKINISSPLANLCEKDQNELITWLESYKVKDVVERVAKPRPEGFGIKTHITSLRRFWARYLHKQKSEDASLVAEIIATSPEEDKKLRKATIATMQKAAFDLANSPNCKLSEFKAVAKWCVKVSDQDQRQQVIEIAKQKLSLDRTKFEYNVARAALRRCKPLQAIAENQSLDDEAKILAARRELFGDQIPE